MLNTKVKHIQKECSSQDLTHTLIGYAKFAFLVGIVVCANLWLADMAFAAAAFDIDKGVDGATGWLIDGAKDHWGKGVLLGGVAYTLFGEGDARQRAQRAAIGCTAGSAVILGLIAGLT